MEELYAAEIPVTDTNGVSLALGSLADSLKRTEHPLGETIESFADKYNSLRVEGERGREADTVEIELSPEGFRTVAALLRVEGLRRNAEQLNGVSEPISRQMADDRRELARLFDTAAAEAEEEIESPL